LRSTAARRSVPNDRLARAGEVASAAAVDVAVPVAVAEVDAAASAGAAAIVDELSSDRRSSIARLRIADG
jgi:hypothetical protein